MGYYMWFRGADFHINAEDVPKAERVLSFFFKNSTHQRADQHVIQVVPRNSFEDTMGALDWPIAVDKEGNVYDIEFTGEKYHSSTEDLWELLAPFVRDDSYIEMEGSDGSFWRWVFENGHVQEVAGEVTFDYGENEDS
jgi:hypothetical protein